MDYRILFTKRALNDLAEIVGYIAEDDSEAASRFGKALLDHVDLLSRFLPMGGAIGKRARVRIGAHSRTRLLQNFLLDLRTQDCASVYDN